MKYTDDMISEDDLDNFCADCGIELLSHEEQVCFLCEKKRLNETHNQND